MTFGQSFMFWLAHALMPFAIFLGITALVVAWFLIGGLVNAVRKAWRARS